MESRDSEIRQFVESAVIDTLGEARTKSVAVRLFINADGEEVTLVKVVYDALEGLSIEEMNLVHENIWSEEGPSIAPFPVIDFQEDSDLSGIAAE